jgi:hypothetical protein
MHFHIANTQRKLYRKYFCFRSFLAKSNFSFLNISKREFFGFDLTLMQTVFIPFNLVLNYGSEANRSPSPCLLQMEAVEAIRLGFPRNKQNKISVRTETNRNKIWFGCVFGLFRETKNKKILFVSVF